MPTGVPASTSAIMARFISIVGHMLAASEMAPGHAPAIFRRAWLLEQVLEIGARRSRHLREADFASQPFLAAIRSSVLASDSSLTASLPIQRAVLSVDCASLSATARAAPCISIDRLPIERSAQFTAFFTKLRPSVACASMIGRKVEKGRLRLFLPVDDRPGHHGKSRASNEFPLVGRELVDQFLPGVGVDEEIGDAVDDIPGIETRRPLPCIRGRKPLRVGRDGSDELRLHDAGLPQLEGTLMVALDFPGNLPLHAMRNAERTFDLDAVAQHAAAIFLRADRAQMRDDFVGAGLGRKLGHREAYFSRRASSEDVSQRLPPIACTSL